MRTRDKFLIALPLYVAILVFMALVMSFNHLIDFNKSYMSDERSELHVFYKQMVWALEPYLEKHDFQKVREYCADFGSNQDIRIRVFDESKSLIADSQPEEIIGENRLSKKQFFLPLVKVLSYNGEITCAGHKYRLDLTISQESVVKTLIEAQYNLVIFFVTCFIFLLLCIIYLIMKVQIPFNMLQKSVTRIAKGDLDTEIEIPHSRILHELALAVSVMAQKLKRQIVRLQQLETYRKDFIANVSHEIKTPLTAISSAVELLQNKKSDFDSQNLECLNILGFQAERLNNLVNDILCLAELENATTNESQKFVMFDLNKTISDVIMHLNITKPEVHLTAPSSAVEYWGSPHLIEQAVMNLIINAVKYSQSPKIDVILETTGETVRIDVKDYGIGIAPEHVARVFERFYRVDKSRSRENGGTGLGLAIVKNIAILHNGSAEVVSTEGKGSTFSIILGKKESE